MELSELTSQHVIDYRRDNGISRKGLAEIAGIT